MSAPSIVSVVYDAASGNALTLQGSDFTTSAGDYNFGDFTLTGQGGQSYTLTTPNTAISNLSSSGLTLTLDQADLNGVAYLLDQSGSTAADGTLYNLDAAANWDIGALASPTQAVAASNSFDPTTHIGSASDVTALNALIVAADSATSGHYEIDLAVDQYDDRADHVSWRRSISTAASR